MEKIFSVVKNSALFDDINLAEFGQIFTCQRMLVKKFRKNDFVWRTGEIVKKIGVVLSGGVKLFKTDVDGNSTMLGKIFAPETFGETFVCAGVSSSPLTVQVVEASEILLLDYGKIIRVCPTACKFHNRLIANMLRLIARKNLWLNQKLEVLTPRRLREKLRAFFAEQRKDKDAGNVFAIPYNREELAQFLGVDRSALSRELGKMRADGLLRFRKNYFELLI